MPYCRKFCCTSSLVEFIGIISSYQLPCNCASKSSLHQNKGGAEFFVVLWRELYVHVCALKVIDGKVFSFHYIISVI